MRNLIPKRRFEEFKNSDPWEQRKLGELVEWSRGSSLPKSVINDKKIGTDVIHYADLYKFSPVINDVIHWSESEEGTIIPKNSLLFPMSDVTPIGLARTSTITKNGVKAGGDTLIGTLDESINAEFMSYQINANAKDIIPFVTGTTVRHISSNSLNKLNVSITNIEEQMKISRLLNKLRNLITLHQRKLDKLKETKSAYLSEMFPKDGEFYPKRRFVGFTDPWEQRKLKDMTDYKNGKGHEDRQSDSGKYELVNLNSISIDGGLKPSGKFVDHTTDTLLENDLVMVLSDVGHGDLLGRVALIPRDGRFVLNQRVALLRPNGTVEPQFLFSYINAHQRYFKSQGAGMSQLNISKGSVENFVLYVPKKEEQVKIGTLFKNLDNLIILHQRKLDKLQALKQAYLSEMFV